MNMPNQPDKELEDRLASRLLDVLIRAGLILAMVMLCYQIFSPFLTLMLWALILAVTIYPLHQILANKMGGKQGLAATLLVLAGLVLLVAPTVVLMSSLGDSVHTLVNDVQSNSLQIPAPRANVEKWPLVGKKLYGFWSKAHEDLPALIQSHAAKNWRPGQDRFGFRRRHRRWVIGIHGFLHRCRHHHGLRSVRRPQHAGNLRAYLRH